MCCSRFIVLQLYAEVARLEAGGASRGPPGLALAKRQTPAGGWFYKEANWLPAPKGPFIPLRAAFFFRSRYTHAWLA